MIGGAHKFIEVALGAAVILALPAVVRRSVLAIVSLRSSITFTFGFLTQD